LRLHLSFRPISRTVALSCLLAFVVLSFTQAQQAPQKPADKPSAKASTPTEPQNPAQIELLESRIRFETDGSSRKEVHTRVHINSELGVRQFARLNFDYNRSFESVEIPLVHITHPSGGTADILPRAITDNPNPAVINAPAYQDVCVKSVRILGLQPGDTLEYRVITTVSHHPLAPDFWLDHSFDRTGVVSHEIFELDLPTPRLRIRIRPEAPAPIAKKSGEGDSARALYSWDVELKSRKESKNQTSSQPDVALTTFSSWARLSGSVNLISWPGFSTELWYEAMKRAGATKEPVSPRVLYKFVSQKIATVDLPVELSGFVRRTVSEVLESGYGTTLEKAHLLVALVAQNPARSRIVMYGRGAGLDEELPRPTLLSGALVVLHEKANHLFLDADLEVAPFGLIPADLRSKKALNIGDFTSDSDDCFTEISRDLPFPAAQKVNVDATLTADGKLTAKVHYAMRGDNELLLRVAFHQAPKEKWKDLAQLLSLSDGFRGKVTSITASDPSATREPFTLDYEITIPKFVDWSRKPVHIPALLPQIGLPDPPAKRSASAAFSPIELGTPLEVETRATLHLPPGTTARTPTGTIVQLDYATFASQYSAKGTTVTASRHIRFLLKEVPADRAADYNAFLHAVQNDEAQDFTLDRPNAPAPNAKPAAPVPSTPSTPKP
jgi:Domain of Unknown Function with PDB structure (DUF3857)